MTRGDRQERKRKRLQDTWDNTPAANPRYGGLTILEATRQFLKGGRPEAPKAKPAAQDEVSFSLLCNRQRKRSAASGACPHRVLQTMARILQPIDSSREPAFLFLTSVAEALPLAIALAAADAVLTCADAAHLPSMYQETVDK